MLGALPAYKDGVGDMGPRVPRIRRMAREVGSHNLEPIFYTSFYIIFYILLYSTDIGKIDELASLLFGKHVLVGGMFGVSVKEGRKILNSLPALEDKRHLLVYYNSSLLYGTCR